MLDEALPRSDSFNAALCQHRHDFSLIVSHRMMDLHLGLAPFRS